jgi:hypothetical protein
MVIISPNGTETYEWHEDGDLPQKVSGDHAAASQPARGVSNSRMSGDTPYDSPNPQSSSTGMVWDGKQWTWGGTGFKPTYPTADDDSSGKDDNSAGKATL